MYGYSKFGNRTIIAKKQQKNKTKQKIQITNILMSNI